MNQALAGAGTLRVVGAGLAAGADALAPREEGRDAGELRDVSDLEGASAAVSEGSQARTLQTSNGIEQRRASREGFMGFSGFGIRNSEIEDGRSEGGKFRRVAWPRRNDGGSAVRHSNACATRLDCR